MPQDKRIKGLTPEEIELQENLNIPPRPVMGIGGIPEVPRAPNFRPETFIVGTKLAREMEKLYKLAPQLRGRARSITPGLTGNDISDMSGQARRGSSIANRVLGTGSFDGTTYAGSTGRNKEISISTDFPANEVFDTLAHELTHVVGSHGVESATGKRIVGNEDRSEEEADRIGGLAGKLYSTISTRFPRWQNLKKK